jgi:hypothetical protein
MQLMCILGSMSCDVYVRCIQILSKHKVPQPLIFNFPQLQTHLDKVAANIEMY